MRKFLSVISVLLVVASLSARETYSVNRNWKFFTYNESASTVVNLPHTWNNDALSGRADYFRGVGNYLRYIDIDPEMKGKRIFLRFGGSNLVTDLLINGRYVGQHRGGSNGFTFEITDYLNYEDKNLFWIIVNNAYMTDIMPTAGAENVYGGIFRDVELIVTNPVSIAMDSYGSDGVRINTSELTAEKADGNVEVKISSRAGRNISAQLLVSDKAGNQVARNTVRARGDDGSFTANIPFEIDSPHLWCGKADPYMYDFCIKVISDDMVQDSLTISSGLRKIEFTNNALLLNDQPYAIHGAVLHRDRSMVGSAVTDSDITEDLDIMCEMGVTAVRVAGGSHNPSFYEECDRRGLLVINDLPFTGATMLNNKGYFNTVQFRENGKQQLREMILQLCNHPSVVAWNLFSELEIRGENPIAYLRELNTEAKALDPSRPTAGWSNQDGEINFITDLVTWNHVLGWTEGQPEDIAIWRNQFIKNNTWSTLRSAIGYKCGGSVSQQTDKLERPLSASNWHPERWQTGFHETYLKTLKADSLFWGIFPDCMFDFGAANYTYGDGVGVSYLGLVSFDRKTRKDAFYLYKANWNADDKFVYIVEKRWNRRPLQPQTIRVYSNMDEVELTVNGVSQGVKTGENGIFIWENIELPLGNNTLTANSEGYTDSAVINIARIF